MSLLMAQVALERRHRIEELEAEVERLRAVKNGRIADLTAEVEQLLLRCQRADECIVDFENATGGLPAAKRMREACKDALATIELLDLSAIDDPIVYSLVVNARILLRAALEPQP